MYAIRYTLFSPSVASAASVAIKHHAATLGRYPVKLSTCKLACLRGFASETSGRASTLRRVKPLSLKEKLLAPAGDSGLQQMLS